MNYADIQKFLRTKRVQKEVAMNLKDLGYFSTLKFATAAIKIILEEAATAAEVREEAKTKVKVN